MVAQPGAEATSAERRQPMPATVRAVGALAAGHFLSYLPTTVAAFAGMPLSLAVRSDKILRAQPVHSFLGDLLAESMNLDPVSAEQTRLVVEGCLATAVVVFIIVHLASIPWAIAAYRSTTGAAAEAHARRERWRFLIVTGLVTGACGLGGIAGMIWLFTLPTV